MGRELNAEMEAEVVEGGREVPIRPGVHRGSKGLIKTHLTILKELI